MVPRVSESHCVPLRAGAMAGGVSWGGVLVRRDRNGVDGVAGRGEFERCKWNSETLCPCPVVPWPQRVPFLGWPLCPASWSKHLSRGGEPINWRKKQGGLCAALCPVMSRRRSKQSQAVAR